MMVHLGILIAISAVLSFAVLGSIDWLCRRGFADHAFYVLISLVLAGQILLISIRVWPP